MSFLHNMGTCAIGTIVFFRMFGDGEVSKKFPLRGLPFARLLLWPAASGASMPPNLAPAASHKSGSVVVVANTRHACSGCAPLTDGAAAGTWTGETDAWGLHGGDLAVGLPWMLLQSVPMG